MCQLFGGPAGFWLLAPRSAQPFVTVVYLYMSIDGRCWPTDVTKLTMSTRTPHSHPADTDQSCIPPQRKPMEA